MKDLGAIEFMLNWVSQIWNLAKGRFVWNCGKDRHPKAHRLLWIVAFLVLAVSSNVYAKREGPTDIPFELRFFRTILLALPIHFLGILVFRMFNARFFQEKPFRFPKYVVSSALLCSAITAMDNLNDESWNPGTGVFVYFAFSISFIVFRMLSKKSLLVGFSAAIAALALSILPAYFVGMAFQQMLLNSGVNLTW